MKWIHSILQRTMVIVIMLTLTVPGLSSAQVAGTDFAPGSFFTVEDGGGPAIVLEVYNTNPHVTPAQRVKVMSIPGLMNDWGPGDASGPGLAYDMVRHRLYQAVTDGFSTFTHTPNHYVIWIDPVAITPQSQWGYVGALPPPCKGLRTHSKIIVDSSTGSLFCTGFTGDADPRIPTKYWLVRMNPDNGEVMGPLIETLGPSANLQSSSMVAVDPLHHKLYAFDPARNIIAIDTQPQSLAVTNTGVNLADSFFCHPLDQSCLIFYYSLSYDSISHSLFVGRIIPKFVTGAGNINQYQLVKIDLNTKEPILVDITTTTSLVIGPSPLVLDEAHHRVYILGGAFLPGSPFAFDISQSTPVPVPVVGVVPSAAIISQVILLDWTNPASTGWFKKFNVVKNRVEIVKDDSRTSLPVTFLEPRKQSILEHARRIYNGVQHNGVTLSENIHVHIPILEYRGPKRTPQEENQDHATYVRFVDRSLLPSSPPGPPELPTPRIRGVAWKTKPLGGCSNIDRFNRRKSGEVVDFIDSTRGDEDIGITAAHEAGHALGLLHEYTQASYPLLVMDYGRLFGSLELFSRVAAPIIHPPEPAEPGKPGSPPITKYRYNILPPPPSPQDITAPFTTNNHLFHLRHYVLGEPLNAPFVNSLPIGDWDDRGKSLLCRRGSVTSSSMSNLFDFTILSSDGESFDDGEKEDGSETLVFLDNVSDLRGIEAVMTKGAPLQIMASSVAGSAWDLYFVPANDPSQVEIPDSALTAGPFAGKIMKYSPLTQSYSEVGTFSMNITEFETDPPPGPPLPPNNNPIAVAGPDQTLPLPFGLQTTAVTLNGAGSSDLDGDTLDYNWFGPFDATSGPQPTVFVPAGSHVVTLRVSDGKGGGNSDTVTINVVASISIPGDLDGDGDIDKLDIAKILAAKGTAASGPNDPRDIDKDGQITILDARRLATMCSRPNCAP